MEIKFIIYGDPTGKARHRSMVINGKIHNYNAPKNANYEKIVKREYKRQVGNWYFAEHLEVTIDAYFQIPKSWSMKKKQKARLGEIKPTVKPDCDNISKIILDSLNEIAYKDDKQVIGLSCYKRYSDTPRVEVVMKGETE